MNPTARIPIRKRNLKIFALLFLVFGSALSSFGQNEGDYRSYQTGSWNGYQVWETFTDGTWTIAENYPTNLNGVITILSEHTITVPNNFTLDVDQLIIEGLLSTDKNAIINVVDGDGLDLIIQDGRTIYLNKTGSNTSLLNVTGQIKFLGESYAYGEGNFSLNAGATIEIGSSNGIVSGTTATTGHLRNSGTKSLSTGGHYIYNGTVSQVTGSAYPMGLTGSLTIDNILGVTLSAGRTITTGSLNLVNGTFVIPGGAISLSLGSTASLFRSAGSISNSLSGSGIYNVFYQGFSKTTGLELSGSGLSNVTINLENGEIITLNQNRYPDGNLTINSGIFDLGAYTFNRSIAGGSLSVADGATLRLGGDTGGKVGSNFPNNYSTLNLNSGSTIEYNYLGNQSVFIGVTYSNLILSGSGSKLVSADMIVENNLAIKGLGTTLAILADETNSTAHTLTLNDIYQSAGTWGGTGSGATYENDTFFGTTTTGILTVTASCTPGTWYGAFSSDWFNGENWCGGVPVTATDVVIPYPSTNYPVISLGTDNGIAYCNSLTINSGASLTIEPDGQATFNSITNNGTLTLESDENGTASLIVDNYTGNDAEIELYASTNYWHYVSSPVQSLDATAFGTPNLAAYYESRISNSQDVGWIAYDGYRYTDGTTSDTTFSTLSVGIGYDYYNTVTNTLSLSGSLNTSGPSISLAYNSKGTDPDYPGSQGFNLLGNPFTSCLDWDQITLDPSITGAIYFTYNGSYASYVNGVGTNGGAGTIPPMQGFFVKTLAQGTSVTLSEDARVHNISQISYKGDSEVIPLIRLKLENNLKSDEAVVRFDEKATAEFDNLLDALKFSQTGNGTGIWTKTGNINFSINGLPFPDNKVEIPVGIYTAESGNTTITGSQIEGLENYNIVLTDKLTGTSIILKESGSYAFQSQTGIVSDRFILAISNISTPVPEITLPEDMFKIYSSRGILYIQSLSETWDSQPGTVSIYDLFGRRIVQKDNVSWSNGEIKELSLNAANGIYIVEIKSKSLKFIGKFNFNK